MRYRRAAMVGVIACLMGMFFAETDAEAQMFGSRSMGRPFQSRRAAPQLPTDAAEAAGTLQGNERFLRENRSRNAFVGSDRNSLQGFVGSSQAIGVGRVQAATETLTPPPDRSDRINRQLPKLPATGMYYPRLVLDESLIANSEVNAGAANGVLSTDSILADRLSRLAGGPIRVNREGDAVILEGVVSDQAMVKKLAIIASFEPKVGSIVNRLSSERREASSE